MSQKIIKANIYGFTNSRGRRIPDYIIMNGYNGCFLEWQFINPTGIKEIDENIGCDGSIIVHKRSHAQKIIDSL